MRISRCLSIYMGAISCCWSCAEVNPIYTRRLRRLELYKGTVRLQSTIPLHFTATFRTNSYILPTDSKRWLQRIDQRTTSEMRQSWTLSSSMTGRSADSSTDSNTTAVEKPFILTTQKCFDWFRATTTARKHRHLVTVAVLNRVSRTFITTGRVAMNRSELSPNAMARNSYGPNNKSGPPRSDSWRHSSTQSTSVLCILKSQGMQPTPQRKLKKKTRLQGRNRTDETRGGGPKKNPEH